MHDLYNDDGLRQRGSAGRLVPRRRPASTGSWRGACRTSKQAGTRNARWHAPAAAEGPRRSRSERWPRSRCSRSAWAAASSSAMLDNPGHRRSAFFWRCRPSLVALVSCGASARQHLRHDRRCQRADCPAWPAGRHASSGRCRSAPDGQVLLRADPPGARWLPVSLHDAARPIGDAADSRRGPARARAGAVDDGAGQPVRREDYDHLATRTAVGRSVPRDCSATAASR